MNRADRRRIAKEAGKSGNKVLQLTPNMAAAMARIEKAKKEGKLTEKTDESSGFQPVGFSIFDTPDQCVIEFDRKIERLCMSPAKARRVAEVLNQTADRIEKAKAEAAGETPTEVSESTPETPANEN